MAKAPSDSQGLPHCHPQPLRGRGGEGYRFLQEGVGSRGSDAVSRARTGRSCTPRSGSATRSSCSATRCPSRAAGDRNRTVARRSASSCTARTWTRPGSGRRRRRQGDHAARGPVLGRSGRVSGGSIRPPLVARPAPPGPDAGGDPEGRGGVLLVRCSRRTRCRLEPREGPPVRREPVALLYFAAGRGRRQIPLARALRSPPSHRRAPCGRSGSETPRCPAPMIRAYSGMTLAC